MGRLLLNCKLASACWPSKAHSDPFYVEYTLEGQDFPNCFVKKRRINVDK
jgi:hypothetical protein